MPSLIYQLEQASSSKHVDFTSISVGTEGSGSAPKQRPPRCPRAAAAGFTQMPFTFIFNGTFFDLEHVFTQLNGFALRNAANALQVRGRLLTVQSVKLAPGAPDDQRRPEDRRPELTGTITATAYVLPAGQGLTGPSPAGGRRGHSRLRQRVLELPHGAGDSAGDTMSDFFKAIKDDLTDRRLMPIVICVGVAPARRGRLRRARRRRLRLLADRAVAVTHPRASSGIAVSQADTTSGQALAETTNGTPRSATAPPTTPSRRSPAPDRDGDEGRRRRRRRPARAPPSSPSSSGGGSESSSSTQRQHRIELQPLQLEPPGEAENRLPRRRAVRQAAHRRRA